MVSGTISALTKWLAERDCDHYFDCFVRVGADLTLLPYLTDEDLKELGISKLGARKKIILGASELKILHGEDVTSAKRQPLAPRNCESASTVPPTLKVPSGSILQFLKEGSYVASRSEPVTAKQGFGTGARLGYSNNNNNTHTHNNTQSVKAPRRRGNWGSKGKPLPFRCWEIIPGTSFVVDRFCNLPETNPKKSHWFLTHFHADHYRGLSSRFDRGVIYCTTITASLVKQQLHVNQSIIREVSLYETIEVDGISVTFLPANHCPGAAMILFKPEGGIPTLHTGDARLTSDMKLVPQLQELRGSVNLILDTTYANPQYKFPSQKEALDFVVDAVKAESFTGQQTLFMFGSYTIGKERVYLEAAKAVGKKVYVSKTKKQILECLELTDEESNLLTTDDTETNLHAVPLWMISERHIANVLKHYKGRFNNVIGFRPTGWAHTKTKTKTERGLKRKKKTVIIYNVPYSEHSSFEELKDFVSWLSPRSIIPSVSNDGGPNLQRMLATLRF